MSIQLIVLDLDGTLLNDDKIISKRNKDALKALRKKGVIITFASGRTNFMMRLYQEPYVVCDYHIAFNGGMIENLRNHSVLGQITIAKSTAETVWEYLANQANSYTCYSKNTMYFYDATRHIIAPKIKKYMELAQSENIHLKPDIVELRKYEIPQKRDKIIKFVAYEDDPEWLSEISQFITEISDLRLETTGYGMRGIFDKGVSKEKAIHKIAEKLNIPKSAICVFGDYDNDLSMFHTAGIKVAMQNATTALKEKADYICPSNNQDGVAKFIEKHLL